MAQPLSDNGPEDNGSLRYREARRTRSSRYRYMSYPVGGSGSFQNSFYNKKSKKSKSNKIDAATKASLIQLQQEDRELLYSLVAFVMKIGLLSIGMASLFKLGFASNQIINRHIELSSALNSEKMKYEKLHLRFDKLFTIGGQDRLMDEQVQWIAPNSIRVIWR